MLHQVLGLKKDLKELINNLNLISQEAALIV